MKPKTVILLVICVSLLLLVGAFAVFFARGGEVLYWSPYRWHWSWDYYNIIVPIEQEETAKEIFALDFTFDMTPELEVTFKGGSQFSGETYQIYPKTDTGKPEGTVIGKMYLVTFELQPKGHFRFSFPFGEPYVDFSEEELLERLAREIESRIPPGSEFQVKNFFGLSPWDKERNNLKTLPQKSK